MGTAIPKYIPEQFSALSMVGNPDPPERRTTRASLKAKKAAEEDEKQRLVDSYQGMLMAGENDDFELSPGVVDDRNRRELNEIMAGEKDNSEEEQVAIKEEVVGDEGSQELTGRQGDARVEWKMNPMYRCSIYPFTDANVHWGHYFSWSLCCRGRYTRRI